MNFETKDSGQREVMPTGSQRDSRDGKGRFDLIPPYALRRLAQVYERGAKKYSDDNWRKGQPLRRYVDSAIRHLQAFLEGKADEDHIMQAAWNCFGACWTEEAIKQGVLPRELDDRRDELAREDGKVYAVAHPFVVICLPAVTPATPACVQDRDHCCNPNCLCERCVPPSALVDPNLVDDDCGG